MFVAWYSSDFWLRDLEDVPCTAEEMNQAADGAFVIGFYYRNPLPERGIAGITGNPFTDPSILASLLSSRLSYLKFQSSVTFMLDQSARHLRGTFCFYKCSPFNLITLISRLFLL